MKIILAAASVAGFAGVALGAASAHLATGDEGAQRLIDLASRYLLIHAAVLTGLAATPAGSRLIGIAALLLAAGASIFAGGLVALALTGWRVAALATPVGGSTLLLGWLVLGVAAVVAGRR